MPVTARRVDLPVGAQSVPAGELEVAGTETETYRRNYRNLLLSGLWFGPVDGGIYQYLPVFLARLGASPSTVSLLASAPSIIGVFAYIPGGAYAERHSDLVKLFVRLALLARLTFLIIALLPFFLSQAHIPVATVVVWALMALPSSVVMPAWMAVMQKAVPPDQRARLNGTRWSLASLLSGLSIALFGVLLDRLAFPLGYQVVFALSFVSGYLNLYYFGKVLIPPFVPERSGEDTGLSMIGRVQAFLRPFAESRAFVRYNVANLAYRLALTLPAGLFSVFWVRELHAADTWIGLRGTAGYAALVVGYFVWGRLANRMGHRRLLLICGMGQAFYPVLTALAPAAPWLLPAAVVWGVTFSGLDIGLFDMLLSTCPEGRQPRFAAVNSVLTSLANAAGPVLGAGLAQMFGIQAALLLTGAAQLAAAGTFLLLPSRQQEGLA